jgi:Tol biopolymer transport system component
MSETRELLRLAVEGFEPMPDAFERVLVRRDRKQRNRRVAAGILGIAIFALAALGLARLISSEPTPAVPEPNQPKNGNSVLFTAGRHLDLDPRAPAWSRGRHAKIYVGAPDGSAQSLVGDQATWQECPAFSPDGLRLAFSEKEDREESIVVGGFSAGALQEPTIRIPVPTSRSFVHPCPVWSPDGRRLASIAPGRGVMIADLDGNSTLVPMDAYSLVEGGGSNPQWSPDGSRVAFLVRVSNQGGYDLWIIPADGSDPRMLSSLTDATAIAWTQDGRSVVVAGAVPEGPDQVPVPFVKVIDVESGDASEVPLPSSWKGSWMGQLLPMGDDRFVVFRDWNEAALLDLEGNATPIHLEHPQTSFMSVSPDGKDLLYVTYDQPPTPDPDCNGQYLVAVPIAGGKATRYSPCSDPGFGDNYSVFAWQPRPA